MKKLNRLATVLLLFSVILAYGISCTRTPVPVPNPNLDEFMTKNDIGLYTNSTMVFKYDEQRDQATYSTDRTYYMISDALQANYIEIIFSKEPSTKEEVSADIKSIGYGSNMSGVKSLKIVKSADDKLWLWNDSKSEGIILKYFPIQ